MLDLHLERLADITHAEPEPEPGSDELPRRAPSGRIEVRNLSFRYGPDEPLSSRQSTSL